MIMAKDKDKKKKEVEKVKRPKTNLEKSLEGLSEVGRGDFIQLKEGKNTVRIVPWKEVFFFKAILHYGIKGVGTEKDTAYPCLKMFGKTSCPVCDYQEELSQSSSEGKQKLAQRIRPVVKYYVNALDRNRTQEGIKMFGMTSKMMRQLKGFLEDEDYGDITDIEEGKDIVITREGTGFHNTSYELRVRAKSTILDHEDWEDELHNLEEEVVKKVSSDFLSRRVEDLKKALKSGKKDKEEEEEDDDNEDDDDKKEKGGKEDDDDDD